MFNKKKSLIVVIATTVAIAIAIGLYFNMGVQGKIDLHKEVSENWENVVEYPKELDTVIVPKDFTGVLVVEGRIDTTGIIPLENPVSEACYVRRKVSDYNINWKSENRDSEWTVIESTEQRADKITLKGIDLTDNIEKVEESYNSTTRILDNSKQELVEYLNSDKHMKIAVKYEEGEITKIEKPLYTDEPGTLISREYTKSVLFNTMYTYIMALASLAGLIVLIMYS